MSFNEWQEENDELKKRKDESGEGYAWTDYVSLPFTQGVSFVSLDGEGILCLFGSDKILQILLFLISVIV